MKALQIPISIILIAFLFGCSGGSSSPPSNVPNPPPPPPPPSLQSISINNLADNIVQGTQVQLGLVGEFSDNSQETISTGITWSSSDESVVTISSSGVLNAVAAGTSTITAQVDSVSVSSLVTIAAPPVQPPPVELQSISINNLADTIVQGTQAQLSIIGEFNNNTQDSISTGITWSSSDASVISITSSGVVNAVAPGTATITAQVSSISTSQEVTINPPTLTSMQLSSALSSLALGLDTQISGTGTFNNGVSSVLENIQFSSSDETIATVSEQGVVSTLKEGTVTITGELAGVSDTIELIITEAELLSINIQINDLSIAEGTSTIASAVGTFTDSSSSPIIVTWQSSDESIATIDDQGAIEAVGVGQVEISAVLDSIVVDPIVLDVTDAIAVGLSPIANASIALGLNAQRSAELQFSNDTVQAATEVQWSSSDTDIVSVTVNNDVATLQANMSGSVTITAQAQGFSTSFTATVTEAVVQSVELTQSDINLPVGVSTTVSLLANLSDGSQSDVTYNALFSVSPSNIASVGSPSNQEVNVSGEEEGSAVLTGSFQAFSANANVTVTDAVATGLVIESGQTTEFPLGSSRELEVLVEYSDSSRLAQATGVTWQVSDPSIGSIGADGSSVADVSASQTGSFSITVTYLSFSVSFDITVTDAEPESLSITVPTVFLNDTTKRATAEFTFTDNTTGDATDSVIWTVDNTNIATVENSSPNEGLISPQSAGSTIMSASYNGGELTNSAALEVEPMEKGFLLLNYGSTPSVTLGAGSAQTTVQFTQVSGTSINLEVLGGGEIALADGVSDFTSLTQADTLSFSSGTLTLTQNGTQSIAVLKNANGIFGVLQIHEVRLQGSDAESSQVAFSWAIRTDGSDNFSNYQVENQVKLVICFFAECTLGDLPRFLSTTIEKSETPLPAQFELIEFVFISIGRDYTAANLRAQDLNNVSTMSFDGLTEGQQIPQGYGVPFKLLSTSTNGQDASMDFFFDIEGQSNLTFTVRGRVTTN